MTFNLEYEIAKETTLYRLRMALDEIERHPDFDVGIEVLRCKTELLGKQVTPGILTGE